MKPLIPPILQVESEIGRGDRENNNYTKKCILLKIDSQELQFILKNKYNQDKMKGE